MLLEKQSMSVIAAIDFGTSRSGYAYAFSADQEIIRQNHWAEQPCPYPKTLTHLLYSPDRNVVAWGWEAQKMMINTQAAFENKYYFFDKFKMALRENNTQAKPTIINHDQSFPVIDLITDYLKLMKEIILGQIQKATGDYINPKEILWCLTVPAIWTEREKQFMRQAAQQAGLIGSDEANRLMLVLEPEAAAIYCREKEASQALIPGSRLMVVDCGGGTVDITAHEVLADHRFREISEGGGGAYGSMYVDLWFEQFLDAQFSKTIRQNFREKHASGYLELLEAWEKCKCNFNPKSNQATTFFPINASFYKFLLLNRPDLLDNLAEKQQGDDQRVHLDRQTMLAIFEPVLQGILEEIRKQLNQLGDCGCDFIYLVGGFSNSLLLQERIEAEFGSAKTKIIKPQKQDAPGSAIMEGAVLFGLNPQHWLRSRKMRSTYGCASSALFEEGIDPKQKKLLCQTNQQNYCQDRFLSFVEKGTEVDVDLEISQTVYPFEADQKAVTLKFYGTARQNVRYVDESGVQYLGELLVEMPDTQAGQNRPVEIKMYFGRTEIQVKACDRTSGQEYKTTLNFLQNESSSDSQSNTSQQEGGKN